MTSMHLIFLTVNQDVVKRSGLNALLRASSSAAVQMPLPMLEENVNLQPLPFFRTNERVPVSKS
jgi:hypothetical protein